MVLKVYHVTSDDFAAKILEKGFRDGRRRGNYQGVYISNFPLDPNEGTKGEFVFEIELDESAYSDYEIVEKGKPYREWIIPAHILNTVPKRVLPESEWDKLFDFPLPTIEDGKRLMKQLDEDDKDEQL